jgi:hypothetical protein
MGDHRRCPEDFPLLISGRHVAHGTRSRFRLRTFGAAWLAILVAGCSSSPPANATPAAASPASSAGPGVNPASATGSAASPGAYPFPDPAAVFSPTEPPIDLAVTPETGNTVTALIPAAGGALSATGADGTVYTLTIPDKALVADTEISMTPVSAVKGLPTGGDVTYAVQLAPDGLHLDDFATLTITPAVALPIDQQIPFGYEAAGAGMFLALPVVKDPRIQLRILHFSGYGVTKGLLADLAPLRQRLGGDAEARLNSQVAELFTRERVLEQSGQGVPLTFPEEVRSLLDEFQRQVVDVRLAAAGNSCANARLALESLLNVTRERVLLFPETDPTVPVSLLTTLAHVCTQEEYELCRDDHIVWRMLPVIFEMEHQRQVLGTPDEAEWAFEKNLAAKCLTFEVRFDSEASVQQGPIRGVSTVTSRVFIALDPDSLRIIGHSSLTNTAFKITPSVSGGCSVKGTRGGSELQVTDLSFAFTPGTTAQDPGTLKDVTLTYLPGQTTETGTISCPGAPTQSFSSLNWSDMYLGTHASEKATPGGPYATKEWTVAQAAKMGTKAWDLTAGASGITEHGTFELYHEPR